MGSCSTEQCATTCHKGASCGADDYNWCAVPHRPWDTLLFAGIAVVFACLSQGPYSSLIVLVAGEPCMKEQSTLHRAGSATRPWPSCFLNSLVWPGCVPVSERLTMPQWLAVGNVLWVFVSPTHTSSG